MSRFLVAYGPKPRIWCTTCAGSTLLVPRLDGTVRPEDVTQVKRLHVCGPGPWDLETELSAAAHAAEDDSSAVLHTPGLSPQRAADSTEGDDPS